MIDEAAIDELVRQVDAIRASDATPEQKASRIEAVESEIRAVKGGAKRHIRGRGPVPAAVLRAQNDAIDAANAARTRAQEEAAS